MESALTLGELLSAWERVQENEGCAGSDGATIRAFAPNVETRLKRLIQRIDTNNYIPFPLLQIVVEKRPDSGKTRTLLVPSVQDRILQTAIARELSHSFEEEFLECSFAYRPGRGVDRAVARIHELHLEGYEFLVDGDIHTFFDEVSHDLLLEKLEQHTVRPSHLRLLRQWIRSEYWDGSRVIPIHKGIPQGSPVSPLLANFFLESFDLALEKSGAKLIRYADDFLILTRTEDAARQALESAADLLLSLKLDLNLEKTHLVSFRDGFRFLGAYFENDEIWTPWKNGHRQGKLIFMAHPLPQRLRYKYEFNDNKPAMAEAFERLWDSAPPPPPVPESNSRSDTLAFLYLTQQGSVLRKSGDRLLVEKEDEILLDTPYHKLDHILVFGNVQITTQAMAELLEKSIPLNLFSRQGNFRGMLMPAMGKNITLRVKQFQLYASSDRALSLAREFVTAKIENGIAVTARLARRNSEPGFAVPELGSRLDGIKNAQSVAELDGVEGAAARQYFQGLMHFNKSNLVWDGRKRHPAEDPLNALLSFAYTLLMQEVSALLEGVGLDPFLGFLHQLDYGRPSLALDVIEPFRHPIADRLVLQLVNRQIMGVDDFVKRDDRQGLFLKPDALIKFFECHEKWMLHKPLDQPCFRQRLRHEVERLSVAIRDESAFIAYRFDHEVGEEECFTSSVTI